MYVYLASLSVDNFLSSMHIPLFTDVCLISTYSPLDNQLTLGNLIGNEKQKWFCPRSTTRNKKQIQYSLKSALGMYEGTLSVGKTCQWKWPRRWGLGKILALRHFLYPLNSRPYSLSCMNSLSLLSTWTVEHFSLHGERARSNKASEWFSLDFYQVKSRTTSKLWLYYLSPHWSPAWTSHSDYEVSAQRTYYLLLCALKSSSRILKLIARATKALKTVRAGPLSIFVSFSQSTITQNRGMFFLQKNIQQWIQKDEWVLNIPHFQ